MSIVIKRLAVAIVVGLVIFFSISALTSSESTDYSPPSKLKIGTWNLEWFGAYHRSEEDLQVIADIIDKEGIDILCLQEITCAHKLNELAELLDYEFFYSPQWTPQKLALLWNPRRVEVVRFEPAAFNALERVAKHGLGYDSRQPLVFSIKAGEFDFTLMNVHLKSGPESDRSVEIRNIQYDTINTWLAGELGREGSEKDIIIAGDFNSYTTGISSERLLQANHVSFVTDSLPANDYSSIYYTWDDGEPTRRVSVIDQIAVTDTLRNGEFWKVRPITDWDTKIGQTKYEKFVSDHLPVVAVFHAEKDLD